MAHWRVRDGGAVIGHQIDRHDGAVVGGVAGALVGSAIGSQMDYRDQQIEYPQSHRDIIDDDAGFAPPPPNRLSSLRLELLWLRARLRQW